MYIDWSEIARRVGVIEIDEAVLQDFCEMLDIAVNKVMQLLQAFNQLQQEFEEMISESAEEDPKPERQKTFYGRGSRVFPLQRRMLLPWYTSGFQ